jgi:anti-sigma factor RsiW
MNAPDEDELRELLGAYFDGELDAIDSKRMEERLAAEPALAAEYTRLIALHEALRSDIDDDVPSANFRRRIEAQFAAPRPSRSRSWRALAASLILGVFIGGSATFGLLQRGPAESIGEQIVGAHIRALMAPQPADIASSDHHTVKPWFDGKLPFAPVVIDLAGQGFPLVGGRIDVVGLVPVPALVYRAGRHLISLVEIPEGNAASVPARGDYRGYETLNWNEGGITYWVVSDANDQSLHAFVKALRSAAGSSPDASNTIEQETTPRE